MTFFAFFFEKAVNCHSLFVSFEFKQESYFISLYLFFKIWSVSADYFLRICLNFFSRYLELRADFESKRIGNENLMKNALIRNYAANSDALFVNDMAVFIKNSHPSLLQRLEALNKPRKSRD